MSAAAQAGSARCGANSWTLQLQLRGHAEMAENTTSVSATLMEPVLREKLARAIAAHISKSRREGVVWWEEGRVV